MYHHRIIAISMYRYHIGHLYYQQKHSPLRLLVLGSPRRGVFPREGSSAEESVFAFEELRGLTRRRLRAAGQQATWPRRCDAEQRANQDEARGPTREARGRAGQRAAAARCLQVR